MRKRAAYRPRLIRIPVTGLRDEIALRLHASLVTLERAPSQACFDALAEIFNIVGLTIENDARLTDESRCICGGAAALNQVEERVCLHGRPPLDHELTPIRIAANTIDAILFRLDATRMYGAMVRLQQIRLIPQQQTPNHPERNA
jgi:hypothetical protein